MGGIFAERIVESASPYRRYECIDPRRRATDRPPWAPDLDGIPYKIEAAPVQYLPLIQAARPAWLGRASASLGPSGAGRCRGHGGAGPGGGYPQWPPPAVAQVQGVVAVRGDFLLGRG